MSALISGGSAIAGGIFGAQGSSTKSGPPKYQKKAQKQLYGQANTAYNQAVAGAPDQFYAPMDPLTQQGINQTGIYAQGAGQQAANQVAGYGANALSAGGAGAAGSAGALYNASVADPTNANISAAGRYADNPYLNGLIDASSRDVVRNLTESVIPGFRRSASMGDNSNSTRVGNGSIAEGIAFRGAQDRIGDIASTIRGGAYTSGMDLAERARVANLGGLEAAGGLYGNIANQGLEASQAGQTMNYNNLDAMVKAGQISQADAQGIINGQLAKNEYGLNLLQKKASATGLNSVNGGTVATSGGGLQGAAQGAVGGATAGLGLYNAYRGVSNGTYGNNVQYAQNANPLVYGGPR